MSTRKEWKMDSVNSLPSSSPNFFTKFPLSNAFKFPRNSFSVKRRRSRHNPRHLRHRNKQHYNPLRHHYYSNNNFDNYNNTLGFDNQNLKLVLDVSQISSVASSKLHRFLSPAQHALADLATLITLDDNNRLVFSCRRSTLQFTGVVLLCGFVVVTAFRFLVRLGLGFRERLRFGSNKRKVVVRRDRSLGGREVVVAVRENKGEQKRASSSSAPRAFDNPGGASGSGFGSDVWMRYRSRSQGKLPKWWPLLLAAQEKGMVDNPEDYQREANRLIRAITDNRTSGKDVTERDIIQLRRICRTSAVEISFDTTNTRDSFYRTSIDFVLNSCSSAPSCSTFVEIDGEDARQFIAGLAENIGLENIRAARMVSAAVAARTRSWFLQAWAFEVQGNHSDAVLELSKMCLVLRTFPPEHSSPEMEMVARGLGKNLKVEQREHLLNMFVSVCSEDSHQSAAEALGLMLFREGI